MKIKTLRISAPLILWRIFDECGPSLIWLLEIMGSFTALKWPRVPKDLLCRLRPMVVLGRLRALEDSECFQGPFLVSFVLLQTIYPQVWIEFTKADSTFIK